mmetsp:Transcript_2981/g.7075  ORF Transcript_2981/g.7075 Transcript_2981/m.7075 type:complete len:220 (-) Transcript_2981:677-1336(-)
MLSRALRVLHRLVTRALRPVAADVPLLGSRAALGAAVAPFPDVPLAAHTFLAILLHLGLLAQVVAILVAVRVAEDPAGAPTGTASRGAQTPLSDNPSSLLNLRLGSLSRRFPTVRQGWGNHQLSRDRAVGRLLAHHLALRSWTVLGLSASPLALGLGANRLAAQRAILVAVQLALWFVALGAALRGIAVQRLVPHAWVLRTEHGAAGITAIHLAPFEII